MKEIDNVFDYAPAILEGIKKGAFLNVKGPKGLNSMAIGWGSIGIQWRETIFTAYVKRSRYTHELLSDADEFTVNVPYPNPDAKLVAYLGTVSGRDEDKIKGASLELIESQNVSTPALKIPSIVLECQVIYAQEQIIEELREEKARNRYYPEDNPKEHQPHTVCEATIKRAYIIE